MSLDNVRRVQVQASLQKFLDGQIASRMSHKINSANLCAENEMKKYHYLQKTQLIIKICNEKQSTNQIKCLVFWLKRAHFYGSNFLSLSSPSPPSHIFSNHDSHRFQKLIICWRWPVDLHGCDSRALISRESDYPTVQPSNGLPMTKTFELSSLPNNTN